MSIAERPTPDAGGRRPDRTSRRRRRRVLGGAATAFVVASSQAASGGDTGGSAATPVLNWYINPDSGGQAEIAARCTEEADGAYTIEVSQLPRNSPGQRRILGVITRRSRSS